MTKFPNKDADFREHVITRVEKGRLGYDITCDDGWSLFCGEGHSVVPEVGQTARLYGAGEGHPVRGLSISGLKCWYRTEAEDKEHHEILNYGADAADWLARWDSGRSVWTIEMGGLGPGYEQCIHITSAEILRWLLEHKPALDGADYRALDSEISAAIHKVEAVEKLGLSGAQWGAAMTLAIHLYREGPRAIMKKEEIKDRHIQVSRTFPGMAA